MAGRRKMTLAVAVAVAAVITAATVAVALTGGVSAPTTKVIAGQADRALAVAAGGDFTDAAPAAPDAAGLAPAPATRPEPPTTTTEPPPIGPVALTGCPPPPRKPSTGSSSPWHPAQLIPEASLPAPEPAATRSASLTAISGKGVWIWKYRLSDGGSAAVIVHRARQAGLRQIWLRVGDSKDGFYGAATLEQLVPAAHAAGIAVIGWGFPYLYDPAGDAAWSIAALNWRSRDGARIDGFSPDIETAGEGTALSARRAVLYLSLVRPTAASTKRPLIATVFPPTDKQLVTYPFAAIAPYVDAFAPMVYWGCREPGDAATAAIERLKGLAPVHVIGQGYDMGPEGGRVGAPSGLEVLRFFDVARRQGARGASLWDWQEMTADHWSAVTHSYWPAAR